MLVIIVPTHKFTHALGSPGLRDLQKLRSDEANFISWGGRRRFHNSAATSKMAGHLGPAPWMTEPLTFFCIWWDGQMKISQPH